MLIGLTTMALTLTGLLAWAAGSARSGSEQKERRRREHYVLSHVDHVNTLDVERRLADHFLPAPLAELMAGAERLGLRAPTMWRWIERNDAELLALMIRAGVGRDAVERHLAQGTVPDRRSLTFFADLRSGPSPVDVVPPTAPTSAAPVSRRELIRFDDLPPISEPGFWPHLGDQQAS